MPKKSRRGELAISRTAEPNTRAHARRVPHSVGEWQQQGGAPCPDSDKRRRRRWSRRPSRTRRWHATCRTRWLPPKPSCRRRSSWLRRGRAETVRAPRECSSHGVAPRIAATFGRGRVCRVFAAFVPSEHGEPRHPPAAMPRSVALRGDAGGVACSLAALPESQSAQAAAGEQPVRDGGEAAASRLVAPADCRQTASHAFRGCHAARLP